MCVCVFRGAVVGGLYEWKLLNEKPIGSHNKKLFTFLSIFTCNNINRKQNTNTKHTHKCAPLKQQPTEKKHHSHKCYRIGIRKAEKFYFSHFYDNSNRKRKKFTHKDFDFRFTIHWRMVKQISSHQSKWISVRAHTHTDDFFTIRPILMFISLLYGCVCCAQFVRFYHWRNEVESKVKIKAIKIDRKARNQRDLVKFLFSPSPQNKIISFSCGLTVFGKSYLTIAKWPPIQNTRSFWTCKGGGERGRERVKTKYPHLNYFGFKA